MAKPNLSQIANNSWSDEFDVDSIIANETKAMEITNMSNSPAVTSNTGIQTQPSNTPSTYTSPIESSDPWKKEMNTVLDTATEESGLSPTFKDSGTVTPQQNLNQQSQQSNVKTQQNNEDNNQVNYEDPYILAFNILQEFDLLRLPENVDFNKLDVNTLSMYKQETLHQQQEEALNFIRNNAAQDPLLLQLFDYAYYGKAFADIPKMQGILKEEFNFATYNISTEKAQKAIVKLYYTEGLNPADSRDRKIIENIPNQLNDLAENLTLKKEAEEAKRHFVLLAQQKADVEEKRMLQLIEQQKYIESQREQELHSWNNDFVESLNMRNWSDGKKAQIGQEASFIQLENGERMPLWQYKQEIIFNNPVLFQVFLDFTSRFNLETGVFGKKSEEHIPQATLNKIVQRLQNKSNMSRSTLGSNANPLQNKNGKQPQVVDVKKNWF
jgi:hypothetical protein